MSIQEELQKAEAKADAALAKLVTAKYTALVLFGIAVMFCVLLLSKATCA